GIDSSRYILAAIIAHFTGIFTCGFFVKFQVVAKNIMFGGMGLCLAATLPFFFAPSSLWAIGLIIIGYASGCSVAAWGYFLRNYTPKNDRIKSCADVLIYSNLLMIVVNFVAINWSIFIGLSFSMLWLVLGMVFIWLLPVDSQKEENKTSKNKMRVDIKNPLLLLCLFVCIITINPGLMYQVINHSFEHLTGLVSLYWALPYIVALVIMRTLPPKVMRSRILYVGMAMIVG